MLLAGLCSWVGLLAGLCFQVGLLGGLPGWAGLLAMFHSQVGSAITSGQTGLQAVFSGKVVPRFHSWAGLWAMLHICSWVGGALGCAPSLDVYTGWTAYAGRVFCLFFGHTACGILVPQPGIEPASPALEVWILNH